MAIGTLKISVNLSEQVVEALRDMAESESVSVTEVIRRAIGTHKFVEDAQRAGKSIYLCDRRTMESEKVIF